MSSLSDISVAILAGGLGTRIAGVVKGKPKVLAEVRGHPFLEYLLNQLNTAHFKKIVLCTGFLSEQIEKTFGKQYKNLRLFYSSEHSPLGTAGSLRKALPLLTSETVLVMNGDSYCEVDLIKFWHFHKNKSSNVSVVFSSVANTSRYGTVTLGKAGNVLRFQEKKSRNAAGFVNTGIYLINRAQIAKIPARKSASMEKDIFPRLIGKRFYGYRTRSTFIDIGTPESLSEAQKFFAKRFVILDRDGTVIKEKNHLTDINDVVLIPKAASAIKILRKLGLGIIILTNQSVVGRGQITFSNLDLIHKKIQTLLSAKGARVDAIYYCPHKPESNCSCRKPKLGLVKTAIKDHNFDPKLCFVVGDNKADIELGKNIGATTILVKTGYGTKVSTEHVVAPDHIANDLFSAVNIISKKLTK